MTGGLPHGARWRLAERYGRALFELARERKNVGHIHEDVEFLKTCLLSSPEFRMFVLHPEINSERKKAVIKELFEKRLDPLTLRFLELLAESGRLVFLRAIVRRAGAMLRRDMGIMRVTIETARPLPRPLVKSIRDALHRRFDAEIEAAVVDEPALVGGVKIIAEHLIFDLSVHGMLHRFRKRLLAA